MQRLLRIVVSWSAEVCSPDGYFTLAAPEISNNP
jgi:hypothetical protein